MCESKFSIIIIATVATGYIGDMVHCVVCMANLRMADARTMCTAYNMLFFDVASVAVYRPVFIR